jgi:hypothetical protein
MVGPAQAGKAMVTNADRVGQHATAIATAGVVAAHTPDAIWPARPDLPASKPVTGHHAMMRRERSPEAHRTPSSQPNCIPGHADHSCAWRHTDHPLRRVTR